MQRREPPRVHTILGPASTHAFALHVKYEQPSSTSSRRQSWETPLCTCRGAQRIRGAVVLRERGVQRSADVARAPTATDHHGDGLRGQNRRTRGEAEAHGNSTRTNAGTRSPISTHRRFEPRRARQLRPPRLTPARRRRLAAARGGRWARPAQCRRCPSTRLPERGTHTARDLTWCCSGTLYLPPARRPSAPGAGMLRLPQLSQVLALPPQPLSVPAHWTALQSLQVEAPATVWNCEEAGTGNERLGRERPGGGSGSATG